MKAIKVLLITVIVVCSFATANAQRLPGPPPPPPGPIHLRKPPLPVVRHRRAIVVHHSHRRVVRRPVRRY